MDTKMLITGVALALGAMFTTAAVAEDAKPHPETCFVHDGKGYKWEANVDKDSSFYDADIKAGKVVKGPIMTDRNLNRTTEIGVVGIYKKDASCDPK